MGKFIKYFVSIIIIVFAVGLIAWHMLPSWIALDLSRRTGVTVSFGAFKARYDTIDLRNVTIGNPPERVLPRAMAARYIHAKVPITRFLDKDIVIPFVGVRDIYVGVEFDRQGSSRGNWTTIVNNLRRSLGDQAKGREANRTVLIERLVLENLYIELAYTNQPGRSKRLRPIRRIELTNVSSTGGFPTAQIMDIIIQQALEEIFSIENLQNMLRGVIEGLIEQRGGLFGVVE